MSAPGFSSRPPLFGDRQAENSVCVMLAVGLVVALLLSSLAGCSATADAHLRTSTAIADGGARAWPAATPAQQAALYHRARRALWVQRVLRLDEQPEDAALRAEMEQLRAKAEAAGDGE